MILRTDFWGLPGSKHLTLHNHGQENLKTNKKVPPPDDHIRSRNCYRYFSIIGFVL